MSKLLSVFLPTTVPPPGCGDPGVPDNGLRIGDDFRVGAIVYYRCFDDYDLVGSKFRVCQEDGQWSNSLPTCERFNGKKPPLCIN